MPLFWNNDGKDRPKGQICPLAKKEVFYNKKRMSRIDWEMYKENEDYTVKKTKYTHRKGKKREYCNLGWSKDKLRSTMS